MTLSKAQALAAELTTILTGAVVAGTTPSAVCAVAVGGARLPVIAVGNAVQYGAAGQLLPAAERVAATPDTSYDLASVTKVFTAITALVLVQRGVLELDQPIGHLMWGWTAGPEPEPETPDKGAATLRQLLTHTSGLPGAWLGWRTALESGMAFPRSELLADLLRTPTLHPPGTAFTYSCVGYNTIMALAETATGQPWAALVREHVLDQLPAAGYLGFFPDPRQCAATEYQPEYGRGMIRGTVHDEAAWSLGGACGNAGLFGTAEALLGFGELLRTGLPGILSPDLAAAMWQDQLPAVLRNEAARKEIGYGHGFGLRIGAASWMGTAGSQGRGHNGFTGTSLLVDQEAKISVALLTNRVHPRREHADVPALRLAVSDAVYASTLPSSRRDPIATGTGP